MQTEKEINPVSIPFTNNHTTCSQGHDTTITPPRTFILLLKLSSQVALHKCRFPCTSISYEHEFEGWHTIRSRLSRKSLRPSTQPFLLHHNLTIDTILSISNPASYPAPPIQRRPTHHRDRMQALQTNPSRQLYPLPPCINALNSIIINIPLSKYGQDLLILQNSRQCLIEYSRINRRETRTLVLHFTY